MSLPEKKEAAKAAATERGWNVSFSVTCSEGEAAAKPWRRRVTPLDFAIIAAGLALFFVEPFAIAMLLNHYRGPRLAERCAPSNRVVVVEAAQAGEKGVEVPAGDEAGQGSDVITPLNVRDPSTLIMGPGRQQSPSD